MREITHPDGSYLYIMGEIANGRRIQSVEDGIPHRRGMESAEKTLGFLTTETQHGGRKILIKTVFLSVL